MMTATRMTPAALTTLLVLLLGLLFPAAATAASPSILVSRVTTSAKVMALTFDFGSDAGNVSRILQALADRGVKATFFVTGEAAANHPDVIRSVVAQGHEIGNHSYSHPYFTRITTAQMADELARTATAIRNATGQWPKPFFRPPYGDYNATVLQAVGEAGYTHTIMWTIDTVDWQGVSSAAVRDAVLSRVTPGAIALMHVGGGASGTPDALPGMIDGLRGAGYQLVTISELLGSTPAGQTSYVVKPGDTLYRIANLYGVSVSAIVNANNIANPNLIYPNQLLVIPTGSAPPPSSASYTVQPGDTLYRIAARYGTTVTAIANANNIADPNLIYPGQVLMIPGGDAPPVTRTHTVQPGDTLYRIAARYGTTVNAIVVANNIANPNLIRPGQVLVIPG
ncbi:MAG: LysM peptidoglycan-binding domain-containing protein [Acidobacteriota bacterium]|nr:LysM peptidoglycan-binding domain-containing protein [Acidobacteriota bacterium]